MLLRREPSRLVAITQPAHAWISGQLANAWGNDSRGIPKVRTELIIAVEQHDITWIEWEQQPTLNPETGLPYTFSELPTLEHFDVWRHSTERAIVYGYLPALLISMHGTYLFERFHDFDSDTSEEVLETHAFLEREKSFQKDALAVVESTYGLSFEVVGRYRELLSAFDALSLMICLGKTDSTTISKVPTSRGPVDLTLTPLNGSGELFKLEPWPFQVSDLSLVCEGRVLTERYESTEQLREAIRTAPALLLKFCIVPD